MPILAFLLAAAAPQPFTIVENGRGYRSLQAAVDAIGDRAGTIVVAPGTYRQCAVQDRGVITFRAARPGTAMFERETCEDKAALVLRGRGSRVEGLVFRGYRVADGNGAGIRIETGDLSVAGSAFLDSQEGIIGRVDAAQRIVIEDSTFAGLGQCDEHPDCAHSIYLANRGSVTIARSRFGRGTGGHYVKLRVPRVSITDSIFDDTRGRATNYMIDLPEGATGLIARNVFVQGAGKENGSALIVVQAEERRYRSTGLRIEANEARLAPGTASRPAFVTDYSGDPLALAGNRLAPGIRAFERR